MFKNSPDRLRVKSPLRINKYPFVSIRGRGKWRRSPSARVALCALAFFGTQKVNAEAPCAGDGGKCPLAASQETPRGLALGTGVRASAISTSALAYNTSGLPLGKLYHLEGVFDLQPSNDVIGIGAAVVDSATSALAAGVSIRGLIENGREGENGVDAYLGLGLPLIDVLSVGIGGRYINLWTPHGFRGRERYDADNYKLTKGFTFDTALRIDPIDILHIAALAYNVVDRHSAYVPILLGGSVAVNIGRSITIGADCLADLTTFRKAALLVGGGAEYMGGPNVPLRLGYSFDAGRKKHAISGGIGYTSQSFGLDFSLQQQVAGGKDTRITASVRIYVM
jgi:opacity protein-like surface antigen